MNALGAGWRAGLVRALGATAVSSAEDWEVGEQTTAMLLQRSISLVHEN